MLPRSVIYCSAWPLLPLIRVLLVDALCSSELAFVASRGLRCTPLVGVPEPSSMPSAFLRLALRHFAATNWFGCGLAPAGRNGDQHGQWPISAKPSAAMCLYLFDFCSFSSHSLAPRRRAGHPVPRSPATHFAAAPNRAPAPRSGSGARALQVWPPVKAQGPNLAASGSDPPRLRTHPRRPFSGPRSLARARASGRATGSG